MGIHLVHTLALWEFLLVFIFPFERAVKIYGQLWLQNGDAISKGVLPLLNFSV